MNPSRSGLTPAADGFPPEAIGVAAPPAEAAPRIHRRDRLLSQRLFKEALVRERRRADRFNTTFAVLVLDGGGTTRSGEWLAVLRAVAGVTRAVDEVGWLEPDSVLGLILPDASWKSGMKVMHRLRGRISGRLGRTALDRVSMRLYLHGGSPGTRDRRTLPVDLLLEAFVPPRQHSGRDVAKRALDVVGSLALLALFSLVMLAAVAAVKATSPGPVLYRQVRVGRRGEPFTMLKFRTMHVNCDDRIHREYVTWFIKSSGQQRLAGDQVFKLTGDPRVTRVGRWLRKTSVDELPQFLNVLRGDMSLVGPRPPLPFELEQYQPWHRRRVLEAKPGVTGPWQVSGRSRTTFDEMVRLDLRYAASHSLWTDLKILAATPAAVFSGRGAC